MIPFPPAIFVQDDSPLREPLLNVRFDNVGIDIALEQLFKVAKKFWRVEGLTTRDLAGTVTIVPQKLRLSDAVKLVLKSARVPLTVRVVSGEYIIAPRTSTAVPVTSSEPSRSTADVRPRPAQPVALNLQLGHSSKIKMVRFSPDGRFLLTQGNDSARLWEVASRSITTILPADSFAGYWRFSADGTYLERSRERLRLADGQRLPDELERPCERDEETVYRVSDDGKYLLEVFRPYTSHAGLRLLERATGKRIPLPLIAQEEIHDATLLPGKRSLIRVRRYNNFVIDRVVDERRGGGYIVSIHDVATGRMISKLPVEAERIAVSPDGVLLACALGNRAWLVDMASSRTVATLGNTSDPVAGLSVAPGRVGFLHAASLGIWSVDLGGLRVTHRRLNAENLHQPLYSTINVNAVPMASFQIRDGNRFAQNGGQITSLSPDGRTYNAEVLTLSEERKWGNLYRYLGQATIRGETETGKRTETLSRTLRAMAVGIKPLPVPACTVGRTSLTGEGPFTRIEQDGQEIARFVTLDSGDWIISTPEGYYTASKGAAKAIGFRIDGQNYPFDQFDLKLNRPDIVLERLGYADLKTIAAYRALYLKRLKQAGVSEDQLSPDFHTPLLRVDQKALPTTTRVGTVTMNLRALDDRQKLDQIVVTVNGVPSKGVELTDKKLGEWAGALSMELSPGRNRIQVWAVNDQKAESRKQTFEVFFDDKIFRPDLYVLTIGVGKPTDTTIPSLLYASKDASDIGSAFAANKAHWRNVKVLSLLDAKASRDNIRKVLGEFLAPSRIGDTVVVYFAGHGVVTDDYYFVCHDTQKAKLEQTGLPFGDIDNILAKAPARRRLLLLDTCQSGEPDKEALGTGSAPKPIQVAGKVGVRARALDPILADPNSALGFSRSLEWMRDLFANLERGSGATVIGASAWQEFAFEDESKGYKNGLFAYALISGLRKNVVDKHASADTNKDGAVSVSELRSWIEKVVLKESGGSQRPTTRQENIDDDFSVQ